VVRTGLHHGFNVFGIKKGFDGLINGDITEMDSRSVSDILHRGGTILQTARSPMFHTDEGMNKAMRIAAVYGIGALVIIGGDGSFRGALDISRKGMKVIGIPGTIDNDIACSDYTIGYDTALNTVQGAIDKIRDTSSSHERCSVVEVMGRHAGYIALNVSISGGAEALVLPEVEYDIDADVVGKIIEGRNRGKKHFTVIVAEGVGGAVEIAKTIEEKTGVVTRATILGYIQRGGTPTVRDRVTASCMGAHAVDLINNEIFNRVVAYKEDKIVDYDVEEALKMQKYIDSGLVELSRILSM
jgi:6-phosphofructokinase 1